MSPRGWIASNVLFSCIASGPCLFKTFNGCSYVHRVTMNVEFLKKEEGRHNQHEVDTVMEEVGEGVFLNDP